jgi:hypothetical protein
VRRSLFNLLALLSLLWCAVAVALWLRSASRTDLVTIRTAPSYGWWPGVKWVVIDTSDGCVVSLYQKVRPTVDGLPARWREDVPLEFKRLRPPGTPAGHPMTEGEHKAYEAETRAAYADRPVLRWESRGRGMIPSLPPPMLTMPTVWSELGFKTYPHNLFSIDDTYPGAYHNVRIGVPHYMVMGASAVLPAVWLVRRLRDYLARRRIGQCPACGYDLRFSTERCPECGREVTAEEARRAGWVRPGDPPAPGVPALGRWSLLRRRWEVVAFALIVLVLSLGLWRGSREREPPPSADLRALRYELATKLADVEQEVARLRAAGDQDGAERLDTELRHRSDLSSATAVTASDVPDVSVVGVYVGARPPGAPAAPPMGGRRNVGGASVEVRPTGRALVLVLCAYEPVKWELRVVPGARLEKVILSGYHDQEVTGVPQGVAVEEHTNDAKPGDYFYAYSRRDASYLPTMAAVQRLTGRPVTTFQGRYAYGDRPFVVGPGDPEWDAQRVLARLESLHGVATAAERQRVVEELGRARFEGVWPVRLNEELIRSDPRIRVNLLSSAVATFDITGPLADTLRGTEAWVRQVAVDPAGPTYYGTDGRVVIRLHLTRPFARPMTLPAPRVMGPCTAIAFDTSRRRLMVASALGPGTTLYTYAPDTGQWSSGVALAGFHQLAALAYSIHDDCFYAVTQPRGDDIPAIVKLSPEGAGEWRIPLLEPIPEAVPVPRASVQLSTVGRLLALMTGTEDRLSPGAAHPPNLVVFDPKNNRVVYRGTLAEHAAGTPETAPAESE